MTELIVYSTVSVAEMIVYSVCCYLPIIDFKTFHYLTQGTMEVKLFCWDVTCLSEYVKEKCLDLLQANALTVIGDLCQMLVFKPWLRTITWQTRCTMQWPSLQSPPKAGPGTYWAVWSPWWATWQPCLVQSYSRCLEKGVGGFCIDPGTYYCRYRLRVIVSIEWHYCMGILKWCLLIEGKMFTRHWSVWTLWSHEY